MALDSQNPDPKTQNEPTREYTLKTGSHTWVDGIMYVAGDKIQLTRSQMERIGSERFEPVSVPNSNVEKPPSEKAAASVPSKTKG